MRRSVFDGKEIRNSGSGKNNVDITINRFKQFNKIMLKNDRTKAEIRDTHTIFEISFRLNNIVTKFRRNK